MPLLAGAAIALLSTTDRRRGVRAADDAHDPALVGELDIGRCTLMGDLNPFPGFRQPATSC